MLFDTHCHLNFQAFDLRVEQVVESAKQVGVKNIVVPGTDIETSKKAVDIAKKYSGIYSAVGIHPHHVFEIWKVENRKLNIENNLTSIINHLSFFLIDPKVVAIGEVGIDRHIYQKTKYSGYKMEEEFVKLQKTVLIEQIKLSQKYKKSLILHNREAKKDMLEILTSHQSLITSHSSVFHCCEPDEELLQFAKDHKMFIGVDGDVFYKKDKQEFIKKVPIEMLVLETDSPYLSPFRQFPNEPKNIFFIAEFIAKLKGVSVKEVAQKTTKNAKKLFNLD